MICSSKPWRKCVCHQQAPGNPARVLLLQMCRRVYKGIPLQVRGQVWSLLLDVDKMKKENEGKYEVWAPPGKDGRSKVIRGWIG